MDLKVDYAFKQLFGNEKNKHFTIIFLNAVLGRNDDRRIKDITFVNTELSEEHPDDKKSRLDILATTNKNELVNIEVQFNNRYDMVKRSLYYWAGIYRDPMKKGMGYKQLKPAILLNIVNFNLFDQTNKFHTTYHLYEDEEKFILTDNLEIHFFEMPKLLKDWKENKLNPRNNLLARWLLLLGIVDKKNSKVYEDIFSELEVISMNDENLQEVFQNWEKLSMDKDKWHEYESRLKVVLDDLAAQREAELREQEALEKGLEEGRERGIKEGRKEVKVEIVKRMLQNGISIDEVVNLTGMSLEEVEGIRRQLQL